MPLLLYVENLFIIHILLWFISGMSIEIDGSSCAMLVKEKMECMKDLDGNG